MAVLTNRILLQCLLLQLVYSFVEIEGFLPSHEDEIGSASSLALLNPNDTRCTLLNASNPEHFHLPCLDYIPANKCYLYKYTDDVFFDDISRALVFLDATGLATGAPQHCVDAIRAYVCNHVYPGCDPESGQPQGICQDECTLFAGPDSFCRGYLDDLISVSEGFFPFEPTCDYPLRFLEETFEIQFEYTASDCWNISSVILAPQPNATEESTTSQQSTKPPTALIASVTAVAIVAVFSVTAVSILCVYVQRMRSKRKRVWYENASRTAQRYASNDYLIDIQLEDLSRMQCDNDYEGIANFTLNAEDMETVGIHLKSVLLPFEQLEITGDLGEGAFGHVYKGVLTRISSIDCKEEIIPVAVKTIKNYSSYSDMKGFLMESALMSTFNHPHVLGLIGICLDSEKRSPHLVLPFMKNGDLKNYLKDQRTLAAASNDASFPEGLDYGMLVKICYDIASGMEYLASRKFVHRDLAARNCMVDAELCVQVADFGLTRDIYQTDYYRQRQAGRVPIKWMSPESLHDRISNEKTDVWSYGVTCWEVFSLGRAPYPTISNHEMEEYLEQGHRLKMPAFCSQEMYDVMLACWSNNASERPTFSQLVEMIHSILPKNAAAKASSNPPVLNLRSSIYDLPPDFFSQDERSQPYDLPPDSNNLEGESLLNSIISQLQNPSRSSFCLSEDEGGSQSRAEAKDEYTKMKPLGDERLEPLVIENPGTVATGQEDYANVLSEYSDTYVDVVRKDSHEYDITPDHMTTIRDHVSTLPGKSRVSSERSSCPSFRSRSTSNTSEYLSMHATAVASLRME